MRLSDAIALGQGMVGKWESGNLQHCALGMACNAVGIPQTFDEEANDYGDYEVIRKRWPWLTQTIPYAWREREDGSPIAGEAIEVIYDTFDNEVMGGSVSFEAFLDWIRSVEPDESASEEAEKILEWCREQAAK